jgi:membrane protease YdiL (CAAX protease family)
VLVMGFVVYIVGSLVIGIIAGLALDTAGIKTSEALSPLLEALAQIAATLAAFGVSLALTMRLAAGVNLDLDGMGLRRIRIWPAVRWGVGGYCAALPFMGVTVLITYWLQNTLMRNIPTPEHPIVPYAAKGGAVFWAAFALAAIVAPVVEETVFRGMLYTALRARMRVWPAALVSGGIFAAVHPTLPGQFLPILALGVVLAMLREKTGSLAPSMVCHAINNAAMLALVRLLYGS